jgi:hypothetical protein
MGYTTSFEGRFDLDKPLKPEYIAYLNAFSKQRHMPWRVSFIAGIRDPIREAAGLPLGEHGEYFVRNYMELGLYDIEVAFDADKPTDGTPSLYCKWVPSDDGLHIQWNGQEKFYGYWEWLIFLTRYLLKPWGYVLNGKVTYEGEVANEDYGSIEVIDNVVDIHPGKPIYKPSDRQIPSRREKITDVRPFERAKKRD